MADNEHYTLTRMSEEVEYWKVELPGNCDVLGGVNREGEKSFSAQPSWSSYSPYRDGPLLAHLEKGHSTQDVAVWRVLQDYRRHLQAQLDLTDKAMTEVAESIPKVPKAAK